MTIPTLTLNLDSATIIEVIRAGLPAADIGTNISKAAAASATITLNPDGSATVGIPASGLSLGAKGGGKRGPRKAKAATVVDAAEALRVASEPDRVVLPHADDSEDGPQV